MGRFDSIAIATNTPKQTGSRFSNIQVVQPPSGATTDTQSPAPQDGFIKSVVKGVVSPFAKFGVGVANTLESTGRLLTGDVSGANEALQKERNLPFLGPTKSAITPNGSVGQNLKEIAGTGLEIGSNFVGGEGVGNVAKSTLGGLVKRGAVQGLKFGAATGALQSAGSALADNKSASDVVGSAITGGLAGGALGGALGAAAPAVTAGIKNVAGGFASRAAQKAEELSLLTNKVPDASIANKTLDASGNVVKDKVAQEVIKQGIAEPDVALMKNFTPEERATAHKMLSVREKQLTQRTPERAYTEVGNVFDKQAQEFEKVYKQKGLQVNKAAEQLKGKKVDVTPTLQAFGDALDVKGIEIKNGKLQFKNTIFEGTKQKDLQDAYNILVRTAKTGNANALHTLKGFIDQRVNFEGGEGAGLKGQAATILKGLRHSADETLDNNFKFYNKANTEFKDVIGVISKIKNQVGNDFKIGDHFVDANLGQKMRGLLSNNQNRAKVLTLLNDMETVGKKYGVKQNQSIFNLANFADVLEKEFGSEAPTSFQGGIERGLEYAQKFGSAGADIARGTPGGLVSGTIKAGKHLYEITRGINQENRIKALRALLGATKKSNFGK